MRKNLLLVIIFITILSLLQAEAPEWVNRTFFDGEGNEIWEVIIDKKPPVENMPAVDLNAIRQNRETVILDGVPTYDWCYGCANTSAAMMVGYYDRNGYSNLYAGPAGGGICPLNNLTAWGWGESPLSATHQGFDGLNEYGHVDDYFVYEGFEGEDPYMTGGWEPHTDADCLGDFMGTSKYNQGNSDGATTFYFRADGSLLSEIPDIAGLRDRDGCSGIASFVNSRDYATSACYTQTITGMDSFTFTDYMAEIDAGRPVMIIVSGHAMAGVGYDSFDETVYLHDTWDWSTHEMEWGESYSGMEHIAVCCFTLASNEITANFSADEEHGEPPLTVEFLNTSSGGPTGSEWDFDNDGIIDSEDLNAQYIYTEAGIYSVALHTYNWDSEDTLVRESYIIVNTPPEFELPASLGFENGSELVIDISEYSFDADGDDYELSISELEEINVEQEGFILTFSAPAGFEGSEELELTLNDGIDSTEFTCQIIVYPAGGAIIYVPDDYSTIQQAVDNAGHGYTIILRPGTYNENIEMGDNEITLGSQYLENGEEAYMHNTVINGISGDVITVSSGNTPQVIAGLKIRHSVSGSGIQCGERPLQLHHLIFTYNMAAEGSAVYAEETDLIMNNCLLYDNFTSSDGGTVYCDNAQASLYNLTFYANYSSSGSAVLALNSAVEMKNCIIYGNDEPAVSYDENSDFTVTFSLLQEAAAGAGNITGNPLFADETAFNLHLQQNSPCIDTGDPDTDGDGLNWTEDSDDQDPDGTRIDMGAFYYDQNNPADENDIFPSAILTVYPNPCFNTGSRKRITFSWNGRAALDFICIYNLKGQMIKKLYFPENCNQVYWDGSAANGKMVSSGVYFVNYMHSNNIGVKKFILLQ